MWWQDDGSWWEDQSWLEISQVWNGEWDESWDNAWNGEQETWDESWSWSAIEDGAVEENAPGVQSLVLSPLISDVFANVFTGLVFASDSPSEYSEDCTHFSTDETVFSVSISGLQCLEENRLFFIHVKTA